jgi:hypothetical protein
MHYRRMLKRGTTEAATVADRFRKKYVISGDTGCWVWQDNDRSGYGFLSVNKQKQMAHRVSYELHVGPIPEGLQIDHLCRNKMCVNPDHLEAVTQQENILRSNNLAAQWARRTVCHICGGPFHIWKGRRVCRHCQLERNRRWREANPEKARKSMRESQRRYRERKKAG